MEEYERVVEVNMRRIDVDGGGGREKIEFESEFEFDQRGVQKGTPKGAKEKNGLHGSIFLFGSFLASFSYSFFFPLSKRREKGEKKEEKKERKRSEKGLS